MLGRLLRCRRPRRTCTTVEFYTAAARLLAPEGVLLANVADGAGLAFARRQVGDRARRCSQHVIVLAEVQTLKGRRFGNLVDRGVPRAAADRAAAAGVAWRQGARPAEASPRAPSVDRVRAAARVPASTRHADATAVAAARGIRSSRRSSVLPLLSSRYVRDEPIRDVQAVTNTEHLGGCRGCVALVVGERRELLRLVVGGLSVREAAKRRGVPWPTAAVWVRLAGVEVVMSSTGGVSSVPVVLERRVGHGRRLSLQDRARIEAGLEVGMSLREIARRIGAAPSTVSREVRRAGLTYRSERLYAADVADYHADRARARPKPAKLDVHPDLRQAVIDGLNGRFSPQQVAGRLPVLFPDGRICGCRTRRSTRPSTCRAKGRCGMS